MGNSPLYKKLNIENWNRKDQFFFFKDYDNPFFNICTEVEVTQLYNLSKKEGFSFFIASLYASTKAANLVEEFRYRIKDDGVIIYDEIHAGSTVLNEDETFGFGYFDFRPSFSDFNRDAKQVLQNMLQKKRNFDPRDNQDKLIHYSVIPWITFFSISHPRKFKTNDSIPKIVFGKYSKKDDILTMPVSIDVHHSLIDGFHVAKYLDTFQKILNDGKSYR